MREYRKEWGQAQGDPEEIAAAMDAAAASGVPALLRRIIASRHPIDIAIAMRELDRDSRESVFKLLDRTRAGIVLEELDEDVAADLTEMTDEQELAEIIDQVPPDVGADLMNLLDDEQAHRVLERIPDEESEEIEQLQQYDPDTAGGLMTPELLFAPLDLTTRDVILHVKNQRIPLESLAYIYVVDDKRRLKGVLDFAELVMAAPDDRLQDVMMPDPVSVTPDTEQAEAARLVDQYDIDALPVVKEDGVLLGQVTVDDIIDALQEEHTEDIARMGGTSPEDLLSESGLQVMWLRLPWLMICFMGTLLSATVINSFGPLLAQYIALAAFIPVINATSGNAGLQSATIMVRSLSLGYLQRKSFRRVLGRQVVTALLLALITGVAAGVAGHFIMGAWQMGLVVAIGMVGAVTWATIMGTLIPVIFEGLGIDPALASGPLVSTTNDVVAVLIYLSLAASLLPVLIG